MAKNKDLLIILMEIIMIEYFTRLLLHNSFTYHKYPHLFHSSKPSIVVILPENSALNNPQFRPSAIYIHRSFHSASIARASSSQAAVAVVESHCCKIDTLPTTTRPNDCSHIHKQDNAKPLLENRLQSWLSQSE